MSRSLVRAYFVPVLPIPVLIAQENPDPGSRSDALSRLRHAEILELTQPPCEGAAVLYREIAADTRAPDAVRSRAIRTDGSAGQR